MSVLKNQIFFLQSGQDGKTLENKKLAHRKLLTTHFHSVSFDLFYHE